MIAKAITEKVGIKLLYKEQRDTNDLHCFTFFGGVIGLIASTLFL